jgi:hypothetical protein
LSEVVDLVVDFSLDIVDDVVEEADYTVRAVMASGVEEFYLVLVLSQAKAYALDVVPFPMRDVLSWKVKSV